MLPIQGHFFFLCLSLFFGSLAPLSSADEPPSQKLRDYQKTELYFGAIPESEWKDFLQNVVTPRFPSGLSWLPIQGQWQQSNGQIIRLNSRLLILIYLSSNAANQSIEEIRTIFKKKFHEQSVLRVTEEVEASF